MSTVRTRLTALVVAGFTAATVAEFEAKHGRVPDSELVILALGRMGGAALTLLLSLLSGIASAVLGLVRVMTARDDASVAAVSDLVYFCAVGIFLMIGMASGSVVLLDVGIADAARRVGFDRSRPLLAVNPRARWIELMAARRPTYERLATRVVDTAGRTPAQVASAVLEAIGADDREAGR